MERLTQEHPVPVPLSPVRVDVRLCGNLSRSDLQLNFPLCNSPPQNLKLPCTLEPHKSCEAEIHQKIVFQSAKESIKAQCKERASIECNRHLYEPPHWAVPARGEARLEPVCESRGKQIPVDLTLRSCFRVGRSPSADVQLNHATSSRRHALIFHHKNGSCYVVDCGSSHGTFIDGIRVASSSNGGFIVPNKVRRGALIRFGGPGAPSYVLKSFLVLLDNSEESTVDENGPSDVDGNSSLVQKNTRLNALGQTELESFNILPLTLSSKRSFDSLDCYQTDEANLKRPRCSSPLSSSATPFRLVSPDSNERGRKRRRVSFATEIISHHPLPFLVTPETSEEEDNCGY